MLEMGGSYETRFRQWAFPPTSKNTTLFFELYLNDVPTKVVECVHDFLISLRFIGSGSAKNSLDRQSGHDPAMHFLSMSTCVYSACLVKSELSCIGS